MGFFNKKPSTAEDIMKLIKGLPKDELEKLGDMLTSDEDDNGKPDTMEKIENIEAKGEDTQTEQDEIDEGEEVHEEEVEKNEVEPTEEETDHEEKEQEVNEALIARIKSLEERVEKLVSKLDDGSFGNYSAEVTEGESDGQSEDSRIMNAYMRKQTFR